VLARKRATGAPSFSSGGPLQAGWASAALCSPLGALKPASLGHTRPAEDWGTRRANKVLPVDFRRHDNWQRAARIVCLNGAQNASHFGPWGSLRVRAVGRRALLHCCTAAGRPLPQGPVLKQKSLI